MIMCKRCGCLIDVREAFSNDDMCVDCSRKAKEELE